jgi:eukaryotic-like serine/threonine-protein kinase
VVACAQVIGRVLATKYRLDAEIGAGAMGRVYRAHQLDLARDVAIKILHPLMASDEGAQLRFAREAKVAARLNHPAVVSVLDYGIDEGMPFLVMELMEGETLRHRISRDPLPRAEVLAITSDVADALVAAHEIRLIHRDIKPENIFLQHTPSGERVRVLDFGLAFLATGEVALGRMTQDGYVGGTPAYMAPEQVHGRGVGPAADIYSLGCLLYELIASHPPFRGSLAELLTSQAYAPPRPLRLLDLSPPVTPELDRLVMSMLSKGAPLRPTPSAVWHALRDLANEVPSRATAPVYVSERSARALQRPAPSALDAAGTHAPGGARPIARGSEQALADTGFAIPTQPTGEALLVTIRVVAIGPLSDELELGLLSAGCSIERDSSLTDADVIWAPGIADDQIAKLSIRAPVVTDLGMPTSLVGSPGGSPEPSIDGLLRRLRAGAADLVVDEITPDQLARKLLRAARRPKDSLRRT